MTKSNKKPNYLKKISEDLSSIRSLLGVTLASNSLVKEIENHRTNEKLIIKPFSEFIGKPRKELYKFLKNNHANEIVEENEISDILKHPENYPELKDGNWHHFFGAAFCDTDGDWRVPCVCWIGSKFDRDGVWLDGGWGSYDRVVFLEIAP